MNKIPKEYIEQECIRKVSDYFTDKIYNNWKQGKCVILIKDFVESLYFVDCNEYGIPKYRNIRILTYSGIDIEAYNKNSCVLESIEIQEKSIIINKPILQYNQPFFGKYEPSYVFLWEGEIMYNKEIPLDQLNISELMKIAQKTIKNREGIILDEVLSNKLIK